MIVYDLSCSNGHTFEGWFGSSTEFERQRAGGLLSCPMCESAEIVKAPMAPAVTSGKADKSEVPDVQHGPQVSNIGIPAPLREAFEKLVKVQAKALKSSTWVGDKFADEARSQHYGEKDEKPIYGKASAEDAKSLAEEGIAVSPILFPIADPDDIN